MLTMMMSFCKKSVHSFLNFANSSETVTVESRRHCSNIIPSPAGGGGLSFITLSGDIQRPANVVESAAVKSAPSSPKIHHGGIGFLDYVGGSVDGLISCTESLGFESSDERRVDDDDHHHHQIENINNDELLFLKTTPPLIRSRWKRIMAKNEVKKFPPPLSSLNHDGKPNFFLRSVRKDGRLELMEVKINRPEIFRASREDGRLRLHLIRDDDEDADVEEQAETEEEDVEEKIEKDEEVLHGEHRANEWRFPATSGGGDGFRRCHELVSHHHCHHNLHGWSQHCVTIK
uniref:Putative SPX and EXS domain-containing protein 5-like n=1 Tax=Davidia involucrata TaxID=16924 RepID=A0A5B6Z2A9_DAVIN